MSVKSNTKRPWSPKSGKGDRLFYLLNYIFLGFLALVILYPLYFIIIASFSSPSEVSNGNVWFWPSQFTVDGYKELFRYFDGEWTLDEAVEKIKRNSRVYARKQMTWFKRDAEISWFHPSQEAEIRAFIQQQLDKPH